MILTDLHVHSTFSDGKLSIPEVVDFYGKRGIGAIAITDHISESKTVIGKAARYLNLSLTEANFPLYLDIIRSEAERAWSLYRMVVIPGYELSKNTVLNHRSAHIVALGVTKFQHADGDAKDLARAVRADGGLTIAAHPVHTRKREKQTYHLWDRRAELENEFDAWEVASGPHIFQEVLSSGLPMIATSDFHRPEHINAFKTRIDCQRHPEAVLEAIRKQKVSFQFYHEELKHELRIHRADRPLGGIVVTDDLRDLAHAAADADAPQIVG